MPKVVMWKWIDSHLERFAIRVWCFAGFRRVQHVIKQLTVLFNGAQLVVQFRPVNRGRRLGRVQPLRWPRGLSVCQRLLCHLKLQPKYLRFIHHKGTIQPGRIMVPPGPEARKRLRAPRTYICNIDVILVLFLLFPLFRNVVYVKNNCFCTCSKTTQVGTLLYVELHLNINIVCSKILQSLSIILTNHVTKHITTIWSKQWHD